MCTRRIHLVVLMTVVGIVSGTATAKLVAHYPLDEGEGTTTADASGNGHTGTIEGTPKWVDGQPGFGKALLYSGQSPAAGRVNCGTWNPSAATGQLTVSFWARWNGPLGPSNWQGVVAKRDTWDSAGQGAGSMWEIEISATSNQISFFRGGSYPNCGGRVLPVGEWTHIAAAFDGTTLVFYIDGTETGRGGFSFGPKTDAVLMIGCDNSNGWNCFNGALDEVRFYDSALSAAEIKTLAARLGASKPSPADGATHPIQAVSLMWTPGSTAVTHDVYFGTNFDDVANGAGDTFLGNKPVPFQIIGFPGLPYPEGLTLGQTYYWRVDEVEADGTKHKGVVWSFLVPSKKAYKPNPANGATFVDPNVDLTWSPGQNAIFHHVYFGPSFEDVNKAAGGDPSAETTYDPGPLDFDRTHFWRVDEFDGTETHRGDIWSFTTSPPGLGGILQEIWEDVQGDLNGLKGHANFPDNPTSTSVIPSFDVPGWGDQKNDYGGRLHGWLYVPVAGDYTFWIAADDLAELWLSRDDDPGNAAVIASVPGWTGGREWEKYPEQTSQPVTLGVGRYYIMALWKDYTAGDRCAVAWQGPGSPDRTVISGTYLKPFEALSAFGARPSNKATGVPQTPTLSWKAGTKAAQHDVYFGEDAQAVAAATTATTGIYQGRKGLDTTTFDPGPLEWGKTYFWRVDEINAAEPDSPWKGGVWSFTVADFIVVDDFEGYTDEDGERIYQTWIDGWTNNTGSVVGYLEAPFAEQRIVHSGFQSMPFEYNNVNTPWYSEAERVFATPQDWTINGVTDLTLYFRGYPVSYLETAPGSVVMSASGADIWDAADEFRFAYKRLTGNGSIVVRVDSLVRTDGWAKAGVMIREELEAGSKHAAAVVTPDNGVSFLWRAYPNDTSAQINQSGIAAPRWVRITRTGDVFKAEHSADGKTWASVGSDPTASSKTMPMTSSVYVGLAVTSHNRNAVTTAEFSGIALTGGVTGLWRVAEIGIDHPGNSQDDLYVAIEDSAGKTAVVTHPDPAAVLATDWTEWKVPLSQFAGVNMTRVKTLYLGVGSRTSPSPNGSGLLYIDDIRVTKP